MSGLIRVFAWLLALGLAALPVVAVLNGWMAPDRWPIRHLQVTAEYQRVSAEQIRSVVAAQVGRGYFDTDPARIHAALAGLPWVESVQVRKRWPDQIDVVLVEYRAVAHWGQDRLVSAQGQLFSTPGAAALQGLPQLDGPDDRIDDVMAFHESAHQQLAAIGLSLHGVRLSQRGSWSLELGNGASIVVGRTALPQARLARLVRVLPQLLEGERRPFERIDLRYTNGFAIAWGEVSVPAAGLRSAQATGTTASVLKPPEHSAGTAHPMASTHYPSPIISSDFPT